MEHDPWKARANIKLPKHRKHCSTFGVLAYTVVFHLFFLFFKTEDSRITLEKWPRTSVGGRMLFAPPDEQFVTWKSAMLCAHTGSNKTGFFFSRTL